MTLPDPVGLHAGHRGLFRRGIRTSFTSGDTSASASASSHNRVPHARPGRPPLHEHNHDDDDQFISDDQLDDGDDVNTHDPNKRSGIGGACSGGRDPIRMQFGARLPGRVCRTGLHVELPGDFSGHQAETCARPRRLPVKPVPFRSPILAPPRT